MANDLSINVGGTWKSIDNVEINVGGTWKTPDKVSINVGGVWKDVWQSLSVIVAATKSISDIVLDPFNAEALVKVDSNGGLYAGTPSYSFYETWLDAGSNTQVWVQRTIISGTLSTDAGSGVLACTSDRAFGVLRTTVGDKTCVIDLKFYSDSGGTQLLDTQRVTLFAQVESIE